jgi:hypothetical protein
LEEKWDLEGRFDILVTEPCLLFSNDSMSFQKCYCIVVNTLSQWIAYLRPYRFELLEG